MISFSNVVNILKLMNFKASFKPEIILPFSQTPKAERWSLMLVKLLAPSATLPSTFVSTQISSLQVGRELFFLCVDYIDILK